MKSRKQRICEYNAKYSHIPRDYNDRLSWLYDELHITNKKAKEILDRRNEMLSALYYKTFNIVLYEDPVGTPRPRARLLNRNTIIPAAKTNPNFIHIYSPNAAENNLYMKRLIQDQEFNELEQLICTPCDVVYTSYFKTPTSWSSSDKFLCEIGLSRPLIKPDWDNIGKCYSDMYNGNIWLDDMLTIEGLSRKFYSVLPRIEIQLNYMNMVYNKYQYKQITSRKDFDKNTMKLEYVGGETNGMY